MKKFFFLLVTIGCAFGSAQQHKADSILKLIERDKEDTIKIKHLINMGIAYQYAQNDEKTIEYGNKVVILAQKLNYNQGLADGYTLIAFGYWLKDNSPEVLENLSKGLKIYEEIGNKKKTAKATGNIGLYYMDVGDYPKAYEYLNRSLKMATDIGDKHGVAINATNLGIAEMNQGLYPKALEHYLLSLKMDEELGDSIGVAMDYGSVGNIYSGLKDVPNSLLYQRKSMVMALRINDSNTYSRALANIGSLYEDKLMYDSALFFDLEALKIYQRTGQKDGIYVNLGNIGSIYQKLKNYTKALNYYDSALILSREMSDKLSISRNLGNKGETYMSLKDYANAEKYLLEAIDVAASIQSYELLSGTYLNLSNLYSQTGKWQLAYEAYVKAGAAKDSIVSADKSKEIGKIEAKSEYDKQLAVQQANEDKKAVLAVAENKKQKIIIGFSVAIVVIVALIALVILRSLRITRKQKKLIEEQKNQVEGQKNLMEKQKNIVEQQKSLVEEKNKEITDSITYAKRLQDAILPKLSEIEACLPQSFVLYKPKDIVAGDFYWMWSETKSRHLSSGETPEKTILIAACDCTGHGVPGAMVSVVCSNALNRAVKEFQITEPGKILDKVRELVLETFSQKDSFGGRTEGNIQDGMDISLASLSPSKEGISVKWAGAYNPLLYFENSELKEIAGDKQPIGKTDNPKLFTTQTLNLSKGDVLYLFTDGYADQFGGAKGKKYKYKQLQELLMMNCKLTMQEQRRILEETFENWKGSLEQTDDVCMVGIRL